jgi:hypothetical protein
MRWDSFSHSVLFGALAGLGWLGVVQLPLSAYAAYPPYVIGCVAVYLAGLAPARRRRLAAGSLGAALGFGVFLLVGGVREATLAAAFVLAVVRSGFLYRQGPLRAVVLESALVLGGLSIARVFAGAGAESLAFGVWGFFLVQSLFFLAPGVGHRRGPQESEDPFERARSQLERLLEREA